MKTYWKFIVDLPLLSSNYFCIMHNLHLDFFHKACRLIVGSCKRHHSLDYLKCIQWWLSVQPNSSRLDKTNWGSWGDTDSIRGEYSVSQCDGSSPGIRSNPSVDEAEALPCHATVMGSSHRFSQLHPQTWRQSLHICQEGLSVYTGLTLSASAPNSSDACFEATEFIWLEGLVMAAQNAWKINVTHFFPKHDN